MPTLESERILVLCYNMVLAAWLRSTLAEGTKANPKYASIKVLHFNAWAKEFLGSLSFLYDEDIGKRDALLGEKLLTSIQKNKSERYDCLLVDEAHTFEPNWFKCCVAALRDPERGNLMIVSDGSQSLYRRNKFVWNDVGVRAGGRTISKNFHLNVNYRNTQEILGAAWSVLAPLYTEDVKEEIDGVTFPVVRPECARAARSGPRPYLLRVSIDVSTICGEVQRLLREGYRPEEIAIVYPRASRSGYLTKESLGAVRDFLCQKGMPGANWISETSNDKMTFSRSDPGVRIVTAHSALGLEFRAVVIVGIDRFQDSEADRKLLYVSMTRAQERLVLLHSPSESAMLKALHTSGTIDIRLK